MPHNFYYYSDICVTKLEVVVVLNVLIVRNKLYFVIMCMNVLDLSEVDFFCQMMNCYDKECGACKYICNDDYLKFTKDNKAFFQNKNVDNTLVCNVYIQIKLILTLVTLYFQHFIGSRGLRYCRASPHAFT